MKTPHASHRFAPVKRSAGASVAAALRVSLNLLLLLPFAPAFSCADEPTPGETPPAAPNSVTRTSAVRAWYDGEPEKAAEQFERLLASEEDDEELRLSLLVVLREAGAVERAAAVAGALGTNHAADKLMTQVLLAGASGNVAAGTAQSAAAEPPGAASDAGKRETARRLFWRGIAELLRGAATAADALLEEALAHEKHYPYAHMFRGIIAQGRGDWSTAETHLARALRQDPNLTMVFRPLAETRYALGQAREAYELLLRAALALPWDDEIPRLRAKWEEELPELRTAREADVERRRVVAEPPIVAITPVDRDDIPRIRIGLAEGLESLYLKTGGAFRIVAVAEDLAHQDDVSRRAAVAEALADEPAASGERGMVLRVRFDSAAAALVIQEEGAEEPLTRDHRPLRIVYDDPADTTIVFDLAYGHGQFSAGRADRSYRGDIELLPFGGASSAGVFTLINDVNVEEYLYSVVPSEMPAYWPAAALEAQAVAARSYTLHRRPRFRARGYDLQSSVASAYYRGVSGEHPMTTAAVEATRGLVLADGRGTLDAVYSANAAGYTESSESVWGFATSLVGVSDPQLPPLEQLRSPADLYRWILDRPESYSGHPDYASPSAYRWSLLVAREDIERRIAARGADIGSLRRVIPGPRGTTGRVESVRVIGTDGETVINRDAIRSGLGGLRSNLFVVSPRLDEHGVPQHFFFEGAGWGHGVGMCQTGAAGMAADGISADEILRHYYPRNELTQWY